MAKLDWWNRGWLIAAAALVAAVPLLWPTIPPLLDLPSHMANYRVALDLDRSPELRRYFDFEWQVIGNLGVNLLMAPIGGMLGVELGAKLIVIMIPVLTALGFLLTARQAHGRLPPTAFAAVPLAYNYPLMFGFVNYCLAAALAMLAFPLWLRLGEERRWRARAVIFAGLAAAIWLAHAIGWVMLGAMCGASEFHRRLTADEPVARAFPGTTLACLPLLTPLLLMQLSPPGPGLSTHGWLNPIQLAKWPLMLLRDRWLILDLASAALVAGLIGAALLRFGRLRLEPKLAWPAAALFALYLAAPQAISGSDFVNGRIIPYATALAVLAIDARSVGTTCARWLAAASVAFLAVRLGANTISFAIYDRSYSTHLQALRHAPRGAAVLALSSVPCGSGLANWYNSRLSHLSSMIPVRTDGFVNSTYGIAGLHTLRVKYDAAQEFQADPSGLVHVGSCARPFVRGLDEALAAIPYSAFERVWLLDIPRERWPRDPRLQALWATERAVIYRVLPS